MFNFFRDYFSTPSFIYTVDTGTDAGGGGDEGGDPDVGGEKPPADETPPTKFKMGDTEYESAEAAANALHKSLTERDEELVTARTDLESARAKPASKIEPAKLPELEVDEFGNPTKESIAKYVEDRVNYARKEWEGTSKTDRAQAQLDRNQQTIALEAKELAADYPDDFPKHQTAAERIYLHYNLAEFRKVLGDDYPAVKKMKGLELAFIIARWVAGELGPAGKETFIEGSGRSPKIKTPLDNFEKTLTPEGKKEFTNIKKELKNRGETEKGIEKIYGKKAE